MKNPKATQNATLIVVPDPTERGGGGEGVRR